MPRESQQEKLRRIAISYEIKVFLVVLFVFFAELILGLASLSGEREELAFLYSGTQYGFSLWFTSPDPVKWIIALGMPAVLVVGAFLMLHAGKHMHKTIRRRRAK